MIRATITRPDGQIQRDVLAELKWDARVQPNEIGVAVHDGVVTLVGWVDSYAKQLAAGEVAHRVRGVVAVANHTAVRLPSTGERNDARIAVHAVRALEWDASVPIDKIQVTLSQGWVTLEGEVEWQYQKQDAEQAVRRLSGVRGVTNMLVVRPRLGPSELTSELREKIVRAAARSAEDRRGADHGPGAGEQGHPEGDRPFLSGEAGSGASSVVRAGSHVGRQPDHDLVSGFRVSGRLVLLALLRRLVDFTQSPV